MIEGAKNTNRCRNETNRVVVATLPYTLTSCFLDTGGAFALVWVKMGLAQPDGGGGDFH